MNKIRNLIFAVSIGLLAMVIFIVAVYTYCYKENYIRFCYVTEINVDPKVLEKEQFLWLSVIDEKYNPFFDETYLVGNYGEDILKHEKFADKDKFSYIVTFGRKLECVTYKYSEAKPKLVGLVPKQYLGRVTLCGERNNKIYVYKIPKADIICSHHGRKHFGKTQKNFKSVDCVTMKAKSIVGG